MNNVFSHKVIKEVGENMSFVGMHIMQDGIIAFADSKASVQYESGFIKEDISRGPIQKLFKNNNMIIVTYGNNEIFANKTKLEDYIPNILSKDMVITDFIKRIINDLSEDIPQYNDGIYRFIIGTKQKNNYFIYPIVINAYQLESFYKNGHFTLSEPIKDGYFIGGNEDYINLYNQLYFYYKEDIYKYANHIKSVVEQLVKLIDCFIEYKYNPVGLPINVEVFQ